MDFGKIDAQDIDKTDFTLAPDGLRVPDLLKGKRRSDLEVYIGCAKWGRKDWIGKLYPPGTKESAFLDHYVRHFNCIELNATHYQIYPEQVIGRWAEKAAGHDFLFCPKVPQVISHYSDLAGEQARRLTDAFLSGIQAFGPTLGPVFLQLSEKYAPVRKEQLYSYLRSLPKDIRFFLELRHPSWFADEELRRELFDTLQRLSIGAVITDTSGRRDCAHMELTIPETFVRFVGNNLHKTDYERIDAWVERLNSWIDRGIHKVYFFMHQHDEKDSPELTDYLVERVNAVCGLQLKRPGLIRSNTLF